MIPAADVIEKIRAAFGGNEYPGDPWIQGSREGCEPAEAVEPFIARRWEDLDPALLDGSYTALSFFSEAGFRFFLPAFLVADLRGQLQTADPLGHLTGGFYDGSVEAPVGARTFVRRFGGSVLLNPRRYGAIQFGDYARYRLSVFTREEAQAIVGYLEHKLEQESIPLLRGHIDAALNSFWRDRAANAPTAETLKRQVEEDRAYVEALQEQDRNKDA